MRISQYRNSQRRLEGRYAVTVNAKRLKEGRASASGLNEGWIELTRQGCEGEEKLMPDR